MKKTIILNHDPEAELVLDYGISLGILKNKLSKVKFMTTTKFAKNLLIVYRN
jgi:hypothetical protein